MAGEKSGKFLNSEANLDMVVAIFIMAEARLQAYPEWASQRLTLS